MGPNVWCMPEPVVATGGHLFAFLSFMTTILNRVENKKRVEYVAIGNVRGGDSDGLQIQGFNNYGAHCICASADTYGHT